MIYRYKNVSKKLRQLKKLQLQLKQLKNKKMFLNGLDLLNCKKAERLHSVAVICQ